MILKTTAAVAVTLTMTGTALAGHANPWAGEGDEILDQYHDENLEQSEGTPGEDEMLGVMARRAYGKLGDPGDGAEDAEGGGDGGGGNDGGSGGGSHGGGNGRGR